MFSKFLSVALCAAAAVACADDVEPVKPASDKPADVADAYRKTAGKYWAKGGNSSKHVKDVEDWFLKALAVPGISRKQEVGLVMELADKNYSRRGKEGYRLTQELVAKTLSKPGFTNFWENFELKGRTLADAQFANWDCDLAFKTIEGFLDFPNATAAQRGQVHVRLAQLAAKKCDYATAVKGYREAAANGDLPLGDRVRSAQSASRLRNADLKYDESIAYARTLLADKTLSSASLAFEGAIVDGLIGKKDFAAARKFAEEQLARAERTKAERGAKAVRRSAVANVFRIDRAANDLDRAFADMERWPTDLPVVSPHFTENAVPVFRGIFDRGDYAKAVRFEPFFRMQPTNWNWMVSGPAELMICAYWRLGKPEEVARFVNETLLPLAAKDKVATAALKLVAAGVVAKTVDEGLVKSALGDLKAKEAKDACNMAAKRFVEMEQDEKAKAIYAWRRALFVRPERNFAAVRYVKNAPTDVGGWLAGDFVKDPANRHELNVRFGKAEAERLVTDVAVVRGGKVLADGGKDEDAASWFYVCYDEFGVHLLFGHDDPQLAKVLAGEIDSTDYEMYLAVGERESVYQFGLNPTRKKFDYCPPWNSPSKKYRLFEDHVDWTSRPVEKGFATAMNVSWELVYHKLPKTGETWPFEMIHWSRSGGVTWGGTDIWNRSAWGRWKFEGLTDEVLAKIKRVLVNKALKRYGLEKQFIPGGAIRTWQDEEYGDPVFYEKVLKPVVDRLDAAAKQARSNPDDATISRLFDENAADWYDFKYKAAELRAKYLEDRYVEE